MRTRRWIVGALLLAGCAHSPTPASAQDVAEGTRIRVRLNGERGWTKGTFAGMHDGVLVLADQEGAPERTFNVSEIDRIQRHAGSKYGKGA